MYDDYFRDELINAFVGLLVSGAILGGLFYNHQNTKMQVICKDEDANIIDRYTYLQKDYDKKPYKYLGSSKYDDLHWYEFRGEKFLGSCYKSRVKE